MKTSNKILLGLLLATIIVLSSISISLFAKYKSHDYVSLESLREGEYNRHVLHNINFVIAKGLSNCSIYPSDALRLEIEKNKDGFVKFSVQGDTLYIKGDSTITGGANKNDNLLRSSQEVKVYLPSEEKMLADFSELTLTPGLDSSKAASYYFELRNASNLVFDNNDYKDSTTKYLNRLSLKLSDNSSLVGMGYLHIKTLNADLNKSSLDDKDFETDEFILHADQNSRISLNGTNLEKLNFKKIP